jgi:hypothetical protein
VLNKRITGMSVLFEITCKYDVSILTYSRRRKTWENPEVDGNISSET